MSDPIPSDVIKDLATAPKRTVGDEGSVEERPISELIEADRYNASKAAEKPPYGLRLARIRYPGTV